MPQKPKEVYMVQGMRFTLKETSIENRETITQYMEEFHRKLADLATALRRNIAREELVKSKDSGNFDGEIPDELEVTPIDEYAFYQEIFRCITVGPHDKIDWRKFDCKIAEEAKNDFLLDAQKTVAELLQFSQSSVLSPLLRRGVSLS